MLFVGNRKKRKIFTLVPNLPGQRLPILTMKRPQSRRQYIYVKPIKPKSMEVLTIEHSAFQQLISKIDAMDEYIRKAKLEQQSSLDDDWVDGQAVCEYLCICDKTLQRLRSAGKITYSTIGNKYYYQIAEIKRCLRAHTIKSSEEMLQNLIAHKRNSKAKASANVQ